MHIALESIERNLSDNRVDHVLDLGREHGLALLLVYVRQQLPEGEHLAENARGLGERERRGGHEGAIGRRQHLMHPMAKLVRQGHDVAGFALIVEQHVGMGGRNRRV